MDQRVSLVTLGVADVGRSRAFFERLGWVASSASNENICFFQTGSMALALYGRAALAEDAGREAAGEGFRGVTLAINARDRAEADRFFAEMLAAGARAVKPLQPVFWGGYSGYVEDPDGHLWEIAHNPFFPLGPDGALSLPEAD